jgi:hypothetical protein
VLVYYGAFAPNEPFAISWNGYRELIRDCGILEDGTGDKEAADTAFMQANKEQVRP